MAPPAPQLAARRARRRKTIAPSTPQTGAPVLVAASVDVDGGVLTLAFDRPIDISAYDGSTVVVDDAANHGQYQVDEEIQRIDARSFRASLDYLGPSSATQTQLTATAPTGVVAVDGGLAWAGCAALTLPFG